MCKFAKCINLDDKIIGALGVAVDVIQSNIWYRQGQ